MPEIPKYAGPRTLIEVIADGIVSKYDVLFSERDVQTLREARELRESLWPHVQSGSDVANRLYIDATIPWAYYLENRSKALDHLRCSMEAFEKVLNNESLVESIKPFRKTLEQIHQNLNSLLPKEE